LPADWQSFWPAAATPKHFSLSAAEAAPIIGVAMAAATAPARMREVFMGSP
jgi:hypothetical protein